MASKLHRTLGPFYCDRDFGCTRSFVEDEHHDEFDIAGGETLWITVFANLERAMEDDWGHTFTWMSAAWGFTAEDNWGAGGFDPVRGCTMIDTGPGNHGWVLGRFIQFDVTEDDQPWVVGFNLCTHADEWGAAQRPNPFWPPARLSAQRARGQNGFGVQRPALHSVACTTAEAVL
jgi:hypothetical protein